MPWKIEDVSEEVEHPGWKEAGIQMHALVGGDDNSSHRLALLALEPEKCALLQIIFPLDEDDVMDAFLEFRDTLKLDGTPFFTTNLTTEEDTHRFVKLVESHQKEVPDSILGRFMLSDLEDE